jgi:hypothetical protein
LNSEIIKFLDGFEKNPGVESALIQQVTQAVNLDFPLEYLGLFLHMNGGEGFVGDNYCRLYSIENLIPLNQAFMITDFAPGFFIFGSTGGGEAFAFDTKSKPFSIVKIPFIPMDVKYAELLGTTIYDFFVSLSRQSSNIIPHAINKTAVGKEIHEIQPVVFGGDPVDVKNKILLSSEDYAKVVVWWNRKYQEIVRSR